MKGSIKLLSVAGIGIFLHWTFSLLIIWVLWVFLSQGQGWAVALRGVALVLAIFACVVLHELGHALTAKRFGIQTKDITLLPIGGLARLERMPTDPTQELLIAIAGPAVNVVIAAVLFVFIAATGGMDLPETPQTQGELPQIGFWTQLAFVNVFLVLFNMLPAFPMDGGRVLRALLGYGMGHMKATQVAASVGQMMAIGFGILGVFVWNPFLLLIALFVFFGAGAEASMAQQRLAFQGLSVADAMVTRFTVLEPHQSLRDAVDELLAGSQEDFPVMENGRIAGVLARSDLMRALADGGLETPVGEVMRRGCEVLDASGSVIEAVEKMRTSDCPVLPVMRGEEIVGLLTRENISEVVMVRSALGRGS